MRKIGINLNAFPGLTTEEFTAKVKALGFTNVFCMSSTPAAMKETAEAVLKSGLAFDQLHAPFKGINDMWSDTLDGEAMYRRLTDAIDCCVAFGAPVATVHLSSGPTPPTINDIGSARYASLVEYAAKNGITIAFENQRFLFNLAWAFYTFNQAQNVRFCWDCGHELCATPDIEMMKLFGNKIVCTHLQDTVLGKDLHVLPFDADVDFTRVARQLKEYHFEGCLTLEVHAPETHYAGYTADQYLERAYNAVCRIRDMVDGE